jgi:uncharacterized protein (DUF2147 family)
MRILVLLLLPSLILLGGPLCAQSVMGRWTTVDDRSNKPRSIVEITERNGKLYGRIVEVFDPKEREALCELCPGDRRNKPIIGLEIISDMVRSGKEWARGTIMDPETGKVYDCKLWLEGDVLKVRGYVAFFFRTQSWQR